MYCRQNVILYLALVWWRCFLSDHCSIPQCWPRRDLILRKGVKLVNAYTMTQDAKDICERLRRVRTHFYGGRGRSQLCRELGITPSTYTLYEVDRVPPVELLVRVSELTQIPLSWLLTGDGEVPATLFEDVAHAMVDQSPEASDAVATNSEDARPPSGPTHRMTQNWIPLIGSTAAGTARFWEEIPISHGGADADRQLEVKLAAYSQQLSTPSHPLSVATPIEADSDGVSLVQCSTPDHRGFIEFLNAPRLKRQYPRAIAWRIDGESMSPRYMDGDLVICSLDHPAVTGYPCVARQAGQIGVNCKIYQESTREVFLIPINERSRVQKLRRTELIWAYRVLASVRIGRPHLEVS